MAAPAAKPPRSIHCCQACGHRERKWQGRCPQCGEWNTLVEELDIKPGRGVAARTGLSAAAMASTPISIVDVEELPLDARVTSGIGELDRVLGGGLVPGSLVLLGGDPGVGKSTLLGQAVHGMAQSCDQPVLYVSGEESTAQAALRARRIGANSKGVLLLAETNLERILQHTESVRPAVLAIDSIQTMHSAALDSVPGSLSQVRECAGRLLSFTKQSGIPAVLVGHVTKDGAIAGPKTLEHVVDVVLHFEGEGSSAFRLVRALKNRFGSTQEVGVFEMRSSGLAEVKNPSELFLAERPVGAPGSVVVASAEGSRPILVEVQALVAPASAGVGRRTVAGVDHNRVSLLLAVLARRAELDILGRDVFVNVAGGVRVAEPAVDLGVACALASSARNQPVAANTLVFGEIGLAGEVRAVSMPEIRLAEAVKLGFQRCILPSQNQRRLGDYAGLELVGVRHLRDALKIATRP